MVMEVEYPYGVYTRLSLRIIASFIPLLFIHTLIVPLLLACMAGLCLDFCSIIVGLSWAFVCGQFEIGII